MRRQAQRPGSARGRAPPPPTAASPSMGDSSPSPSPTPANAGQAQQPSVLFDVSKKETHHPQTGFKKLYRKIRAAAIFRVHINKETLSLAKLQQHTIFVLACPREPMSEQEIKVLHQYLQGGGSLLVCATESGKCCPNINKFLKEYGIKLRSDAVVRSSFQKYPHPKEVLISSGGVINRELNVAAGKKPNAASRPTPIAATPDTSSEPRASWTSIPMFSKHSAILPDTLTYVYPYGCTLKVDVPSVAVLSSSYIAYPCEQPIAAFYPGPGPETSSAPAKVKSGHMVVTGSVNMFDDDWLDREENEKLFDVAMKWLTPGQQFKLNDIDARVDVTAERTEVPDVDSLASRWRVSLQDVDEVPEDFAEMFDGTLYNLNTNLVPESVDLYNKLGVPHEPLSLIPPQFEAPLPPLQPAVFPPMLPEPPPPLLELFDLDEEFASEKLRLAKQTNRCSDDNLEFYVQACGDILGITKHLPEEQRQSASHILEYVFKNIVNWKKVNFTEGFVTVDP
eukprot:TRINITY_DN2427_c0_g1_i1.p1 TRINITY_DN2427_c0_g1~~TRINITY_DN2427_c0_g1_i1.p1  ORF type:complete len:525 (+),score=153.15 TRINITY_DN2427_c0_g1_i1:53-1576(+)